VTRVCAFAAVLIAAILSLLAAACGGSSGSHVAQLGTTSIAGSTNSTSASAQQNSGLAYSRCIRSNGVPNYPDPDRNGNLAKGDAEAFGASTPQFRAAQQTCSNLLPNSGSASLTQCLMTGDCPQSVVQPALEEGRTFAHCMRGHGIANWPDPTVDSLGRPSFAVTRAGIPIDATRSPQMLAKIGDCQRQPGAVLLRQE
jgi:hypothetical protein